MREHAARNFGERSSELHAGRSGTDDKISAVRLALNESCWLGINGEPNGMTAATYRSSIVAFTTLLEQNGMYPILDLHWLAPGSYQADAQEPAPDADHVI